MIRRYRLLLPALLIASPAFFGAAFAQQVDTVIIYREALPPPGRLLPPGMERHAPPPGAEMDEDIIVRRGDDDTVYFIRRHGAEGDSVHAFIRRLPDARRFRPHPDSLLSGRLRIDMDSLRARFFGQDSTLRLLGRLDADSLARFHVWTDSMAVPHVFRLPADSLALHAPLRWFGDAPGARVEFRRDDVEVSSEGDSTIVRLRRRMTGDGPHRFERFAVPRVDRQRPERRPDGVLVVPDGQGGTWIYVPPTEE